ncbi:MAG: Asp-tRNA(Asn)/Glu-tRNA(Gln) amidotransferase subunit GatB [Myxococcota bacterium]
MEYEPVIGLEVHAQLKTETKAFCGCSTRYGAPSNTQVCPVCLGLPGALPVLNERAVEFALRAALALNCRTNRRSIFARKNYFYPDLSKGYQISQYDKPLAEEGYIEVPDDEKEPGKSAAKVGIIRVHLEEDAGKLYHLGAVDSAFGALVDFNRGGIPLIEIVSKPEISSPKQGALYLKTLRQILRYLGVCDGNLEEGSLRCDVNISIRRKGETELGTKVEVKNINSFRFVERALEYEFERQVKAAQNGDKIVQETRLWDAGAQETRVMRTKEEAHDYRYFPEPDLLPLELSDEYVNRIKESLVEMPLERARRFAKRYGLPHYDAGVLTAEKEIADYFESAVKAYNEPKKISNWIMTELLRELKSDEKEISKCPVSPENLARLVKKIDDGEISGKQGKEIIVEMYREGKPPEEIIEKKGLRQMSNAGEIEEVIAKIVATHPKEAEEYRGGKSKLLGFFVGEVMKETKGEANPKIVNDLLKKLLGRK